ncbi:LacI family DNA-binding transcriptional regulator [Sediminibacillus massiliensis]|uniref:LacI family DNA-binding transcriptional regulator n=1 Tax=Sediminibacillus massiliensis TaxID=1926277 RepID=UPI0009885FE0|nr:LacI family DNA-binding transcriptional regulator [Sediminibacillus massiliensis]
MKEINSTEIANLAGVSRSTVSRVINNYPNVPHSTRQKVLKVIQENNYYPNLYAQALAGKKTGTIVLILLDNGHISNDAITNFLITNVIESAADYGYYVLTVVIRDIDYPDSRKQVREIFHQRRVDGGIVIGAKNDEPVIEELINEGFIIGILDQERPPEEQLNRINFNFDNKNGALAALEYLIGLKHKEIGLINGDLNRISGLQRYEGFVEGMKKHKLQIHQEWIMMGGDFNKESGYQAINSLLQKNIELPTAILAANDSVAFGAIQALKERSIKVPDDISIIGIDDHLLSAYCHPPLTTLKIDFQETMKQLTASVIQTIKGTEAEKTHITGMELIIRESCKELTEQPSQNFYLDMKFEKRE